jgi:hypothetical protein
LDAGDNGCPKETQRPFSAAAEGTVKPSECPRDMEAAHVWGLLSEDWIEFNTY